MDVFTVGSILVDRVRILVLRLRKGLYRRRWGLMIGFSMAIGLGAAGYILGSWLNWIVGDLLQIKVFNFNDTEIEVLWGVHATIIAFGLVALSFAWNSVQEIPTDPDIIAEIAHRLRSIEIITFLLTSNLFIGGIVLRVSDTAVPPELGSSVGVLFIASLLFILNRFWHVLDLLLHNSLDDKVEGYADDHLSGDFHSPAGEFDTYLGHFFEASRREIDAGRPDKLRDKLGKVEDLLEAVLEKDSSVATDTQLWDFVFSNYDSLYRRCIAEQNQELQQQLIASLTGVFWITMNHWRNQGP